MKGGVAGTVIVMEYIAGPSMQNIVVQKQEHHLTGKRIVLIREMAEALKYVHASGYIHRDICPRNFICMPDSCRRMAMHPGD